MKLSDNTAISMPMRNLIGIVTAVSVGVWAFFGIQETLNKHSTTLELMEKDLHQNTEFRIKYPRGELGQSSGEAELFMLVEHSSTLLEDLNLEIKGMRNNKVNIDFLVRYSNVFKCQVVIFCVIFNRHSFIVLPHFHF